MGGWMDGSSLVMMMTMMIIPVRTLLFGESTTALGVEIS
jgi:hypothetical protein